LRTTAPHDAFFVFLAFFHGHVRESDYLCTRFHNHTRMEKRQFAVKKLLEAVERELMRRPNQKTLDRLSLLAGFQDWESFQHALHGDADSRANYRD